MSEFLTNYGYLIVFGSVLLVDFIVIPFINKKLSKSNKVVKLAQVVQRLPEYIKEAEYLLGGKTGPAKLIYVLNKAHLSCLESKVDFDEVGFKEEVEKILSCPQSKTDMEVLNEKNEC